MMTDWLSHRTRSESIRFIDEVSGLCAKQGGPVAKHLCQMVWKREFLQVINYPFDYEDFSGLEDAVYSRQIHALVAKQAEWLGVGLDRKSVAISKFFDAEASCRKTNALYESGQLPERDVNVVFHYAQRKIAAILGEVPRLADLDFSFGPGANTSVKGSIASPRVKLGARLACSDDLLPFVGDFLAEVPLWTWHATIGRGPTQDELARSDERSLYPSVEVHDGKLVFVPKDVRSMRSIVVEPILNGFFQKGVGSFIKDRMLKTSGIDLRDQGRNKRLAQIGSINGELATIDLSSASDTISTAVILDLLPLPWVEFLSKLRTGSLKSGFTPTCEVDENGNYTTVWKPDRERVVLEKFSSMGNAFTFELESLLFYALAYGVCLVRGLSTDNVSVFGDDIIMPTEGYELLRNVLSWAGFSVNPEKSFTSGPFRESCGADWFRGHDVRPFYLRDQVNDQSLYAFHNWAVRNCERELAELVLSYTNPALRLWGPDGYGDGHLVGSHILRVPRNVRRNKWEGGVFDTYSLRPRRHTRRYAGDWVYPSYSVYTRSGERNMSDPNIVRGSKGYAKTSIYTLASTVFRRV